MLKKLLSYLPHFHTVDGITSAFNRMSKQLLALEERSHKHASRLDRKAERINYNASAKRLEAHRASKVRAKIEELVA